MRQSNTFHLEEDPSSKNARGRAFKMQEVKLLIKFLQTGPQVKSMNINCYDLYFAVFYFFFKEEKNKDS